MAEAEAALAARLGLRPHQRLRLSASRYDPGDFLASHRDEDSSSRAAARRTAVVLSLCGRQWRRRHGGLFVDEEPGGGRTGAARRPATATHVPRHNALLVFAVPRSHRVSAVAASAPPNTRLALYGWVLHPRLPQYATVDAWQAASAATTQGAAPRAALLLPGEESPQPPGTGLEQWAAMAMQPALPPAWAAEADDAPGCGSQAADTGADADAATAGLLARLRRALAGEIVDLAVVTTQDAPPGRRGSRAGGMRVALSPGDGVMHLRTLTLPERHAGRAAARGKPARAAQRNRDAALASAAAACWAAVLHDMAGLVPRDHHATECALVHLLASMAPPAPCVAG